MQKAAKGNGDVRKDAEVTGQGLSLEWGFIVQKFKDLDRVNKLTAIDGSQSYLLVVDHPSNQFWSLCSDSKSPPLSWLNHLPTKIAPNHKNKYICMDLGSELGRNVEEMQLDQCLKDQDYPRYVGVMHYIIILRYTVTYPIVGGTRLHMKL
eukprot:3589341-Ditylum_brightwellii.AAC.1